MIVPFDELKKYDFLMSDIKVFFQQPSYRTLTQRARLCNSFLYIQKGECRYIFDGGEFSLSDGAVTYLPFGSRHRLTVTSDDICFYRVDFTVRIDGEIVLFSDHPIKITDEAPPECVEAITALEGDYGMGEDNIWKMQKLCTIFSCLQGCNVSQNTKRLMPAIRHLQENPTDHVNCTELASLCFLSTSRFYDLFRKEFNVTPLEYRNDLLLHRAKDLLATGDLSVNEIAFAVGFENAAYFSRFFKKHVGISPSEYADQHRK